MDECPSNQRPEVSVIIPVFNSARTLRRALLSVLEQSGVCFEILAVDDGSSDGSRVIVDEIEDARVRYLQHVHNQGAAAARNTGLTAAKGKYVAFLDADDEWRPDKLAKQLCYLSNAGQHVVAACSGFTLLRGRRKSGATRIPKAPAGWRKQLLDVCPLAPGSTLLVERRVFEEVGLMCTELERFEDWDWLLRFLEHYELGVVPEPLATIHSSTFSNKDSVDRSAQILLQRHGTKVREAMGETGVRTFRSSLRLEQSLVRWRLGERGAATKYTAHALLLSPARVGRFAWRALEKIRTQDY